MTDKADTTAGGTTGPARAATAARTAVVWEALQELLSHLGDGPLEIVDAGGGTGGAAVPLAELGHRVTVVEPSPDSLAALERRAAESDVVVRGVQGETRDLGVLFEESSADLVLMHNVLEYVDDPAAALREVFGITRSGGAVSVLATNAVAGALHRVLAGQVMEAQHLLDDPDGRWGENDPMPRRFTRGRLQQMLTDSGLDPTSVRGVRVFADILPGQAWESDAQTGQYLVDLERAVSQHPEMMGLATQLHVVASRD